MPVGNNYGEDEMKIPREGVARTRDSLLAAAGEIFADRGYRDTTIAEISKRAGTNIAAVNYHFGNKETLYIEAWRHSFSESVKAHPPDGGVSDDAPPEERLRGQVAAIMRRMADENNREFLFVQKEFANPTGLLEGVMREALRPLQARMEGLARELLGERVSDIEARFCEMSIISQCINPLVVRNRREIKGEDRYGTLEIADIEAYANHVVKFSLAGIRAIRKEAEKKSGGIKSGDEVEMTENRSNS
jgi:AcrR family transcriptional regulator